MVAAGDDADVAAAVPRRAAADQGPQRRGRLADDPRARGRRRGSRRQPRTRSCSGSSTPASCCSARRRRRSSARSATPRATPWATPATRGTRRAPRAGPRAGRGRRWRPGMAPIAHGSRRRRVDPHPGVVLRAGRAQAHPGPDHQRLTSSSRASRPAACWPGTVADLAAGLDVLAVHDPAAWWSPPPPSPLARRGRSTTSRPAACGSGHCARRRADWCRGRPGVRVPPSTWRCWRWGRWRPRRGAPVAPELPSPDELVTAFGTIWNVGSAGVPLEDSNAIEPLNAGAAGGGSGGRLDRLRRGGASPTQALSRRDRRVVRGAASTCS